MLYGELGGGEILATLQLSQDETVSEWVRAAKDEVIRSPVWAPDGRAIYYRWSRRSDDGNGWQHVIRRLTLADGAGEDIVSLPFRAEHSVGPIDVSSDGSLAVGTFVPAPAEIDPRRRSQCVVRIIPPSGPLVDRPLPAGRCTALAWSRDGQRLAVATQTGRAGALWLLDRDGGDPISVPVEELSVVWDMSFHPNGRDLLFTDGNSRPDLWRVSGISNMTR